MNGVVEIDSMFARRVGFTSDRFAGYLWKEGRRVLCTLLACKGPCWGSVGSLLENIERNGFEPVVVNPNRKAKRALRSLGFHENRERVPLLGETSVWRK